MSLFAFLGAGARQKAWAQALTAAGCKVPPKADRKTYETITAQMIADDCRVITECANDIMRCQDAESRRQKHLVLFSRYGRLTKLEPYAQADQRKKIQDARKLVKEARKYK